MNTMIIDVRLRNYATGDVTYTFTGRVHTCEYTLSGLNKITPPTHHHFHLAPKNTTKIHVQEVDHYGM